ncbi:HK97-gp10 family putative phage morphogenesis protein [Agrobacterium vitis]|uniref:HK97-gp10 family putative phage morphogenesis protein n=1 Tax=Agrobacterium vitis TaxID=373 RepID=UPI0008DC18B1|nr:HK97-gp10 family putative phage morphogenesis protein [Agrobacterium vitis]MUO27193.1 hypothetical protein [Agrobacterium vitis]
MSKVTFKVEGLKELEAALSEMTASTGKRITTKVLRDAGKPIADAAAAKAPILTMALYENVGVGTKLTKRQAALFQKQSPVEVHVGVSDPAGVQVEFGNDEQAAEPFLRPAWDSGKDRALDQIISGLWTSINKAAQRAARRAIKLKNKR